MAKQRIDIEVDVCQSASGCREPAARTAGRQRMCLMHYRFRQMRGLAKSRKVAVPTVEQLHALYSQLKGMECPHCSRVMNWIATDGQATVISLQHYRSGEFGFLCRSCNTRHASFADDTFLDTSPSEKHCGRCNRMLPLTSFYANRSRGHWMGVGTACKDCMRLYAKEYRERNRDKYNARHRAYEQRKRDEMKAALVPVHVALEPAEGEG